MKKVFEEQSKFIKNVNTLNLITKRRSYFKKEGEGGENKFAGNLPPPKKKEVVNFRRKKRIFFLILENNHKRNDATLPTNQSRCAHKSVKV